MNAEQAGGEDRGQLPESLLGGQGRGVVGAHGACTVGAAHSDLRPATGALSGGKENGIPVNYPVRR